MNQLLLSFVLSLSLFFPSLSSAQSIFDSLYEAQTLPVYFETGKYQLDAAAEQVLDALSLSFKDLSTDKTLRITAYTDDVGGAIFNEKLAQQRGEAVANALKKRGVPANAIISVLAYGERKPAALNSTEEGRRLNRRALIEVAKKVPMRVFEGRISDKKTGAGIESLVTFQTKTRKDSVQTDTTGRYSVKLPKDSVVRMEIQAKDHFFESTTFKVFGSPELYKKYKVSPDIQLSPAEPGESAILRNLFFVGDQDVLLKMSEPELPKILRFLQLNPDLIIEVGGHINLPYPEKNNYVLAPGQTPAEYMLSKQELYKQHLSEARAKTVYIWLLKHGIPKERMTFKGYNNSKMLFPHTIDQFEQEQNRRVEITVTGKL